MRGAVIIVIIFSLWQQVFSQDAPVTTVGTVQEAMPGTILLPVTVSGFNDIGAVYLSLDYNYTVMQLTGATPHAQMPTFLHGDADLGTGFHRITMGWYGNSLTLPDHSTIMTLQFNFVAGYSDLAFYDSGPSCEYANGEGEVLNDTPFESFYFDGAVCGALGTPGAITGNSAVCFQHGPVSYSVEPDDNVFAYEWSVPGGVNIICGQNTNMILVEFSDNSQSGNIQVYKTNQCNISSPASVLNVTVNGLPVANAGNDSAIPYGTSAILNAASGGSGSYSYHWSPEELLVDPDIQNPQTLNLYETTAFTLLVANSETGCQANDQVVVSVTGGPLTINPTALHDSICAGDETVLYAFASGSTGNYTYTWTSEPPGLISDDASVYFSPFTTTTCYLEVSDGINSVSDSILVFANEDVTGYISGVDTLCGTGSTTILTVDFSGIPPWDFVYTFGTRSVFIENQVTTPYNLVTGEAGTYTISYVKNSLCTGTGNGGGLVARYPIPPAPVIQLFETTLVSTSCCGNQWYRNDIVIAGATDVSYTAAETGRYYDIVTRFSCVSDTSNVIDVIIIGMDETNEDCFSLYPNPTTGLLGIRYNAILPGIARIYLFNPDGRQLKQEEFALFAGLNNLAINFSDIEPGLYLLKLENGLNAFTEKIIIH